MTTWVIPYIDQEIHFWEDIAGQFGDQIHSVYFPLPAKIVASGRAPQPDRYLNDFLHFQALPKTVLVNPILLNRPADEMIPPILNALRELFYDFGVQHVTVSNLTLARAIRRAIPDLKIASSTLMGIATPAQALMAEDWIDTLIPDTRVLRDLPALERLRQAFRGQVRLIVNEACLPGCLHRVQHFYEMAYSDFYPQSLCRDLLVDRPWLRMTGAWVLPQHLHYYDGLYDSLKLSGRVTLKDPDQYQRVLAAYIRREPLRAHEIGGGPASVIEPITVSEDWFAYTLRCGKDCATCTVCRDTYQQAALAGKG